MPQSLIFVKVSPTDGVTISAGLLSLSLSLFRLVLVFLLLETTRPSPLHTQHLPFCFQQNYPMILEGPAGVILIVQDAPDDLLIDCHCPTFGSREPF